MRKSGHHEQRAEASAVRGETENYIDAEAKEALWPKSVFHGMTGCSSQKPVESINFLQWDAFLIEHHESREVRKLRKKR